MQLRSILASALCATALLAATPAYAMHWVIYAPDENDYRYWLDSDSIVTRGAYTYATYILGAPDSSAPTTTDGQHIAINCSTGDSLRDDGGNWVAGPHFDDRAYLFRSLCRQGR